MQTRTGRPIIMGTAGEMEDHKKMMELWNNTRLHFVKNATTIHPSTAQIQRNFFKPYEMYDEVPGMTNHSMWLDMGLEKEAAPEAIDEDFLCNLEKL